MLLHVCCANCAAHPLEILKRDFDITMFFYNPNIYPRKEYLKRLASVRKLSLISGVPLMTGRYQNRAWARAVRGYEDEPEGGKRCRLCFAMRLEKTAYLARKYNMDFFAATLSVSPHKDSYTISQTARNISRTLGIDFFDSDFKKKDGFKKTMELSRSYGLYLQDYCGCIYSIRKRD